MFDLAGIVAQACLLGALPSFASFVPMIGATVGSTAAGSGAGTTFVVPPPSGHARLLRGAAGAETGRSGMAGLAGTAAFASLASVEMVAAGRKSATS